MIIVGMTACGKTHYLLKMLENEYKNHFDYIYIVCPTIRYNCTYQNWEYFKDPDVFAIDCEHDEIESTLETIGTITENNFTIGDNDQILAILDDCASSKASKKQTSELVKLAMSERHVNISTIVITQQLTSVAKSYRENLSKFVTFYNPCRNDMKYIFNNYLYIDENEQKRIIETLRDNDYARLEIMLVRPYTYKIITPTIN